MIAKNSAAAFAAPVIRRMDLLLLEKILQPPKNKSKGKDVPRNASPRLAIQTPELIGGPAVRRGVLDIFLGLIGLGLGLLQVVGYGEIGSCLTFGNRFGSGVRPIGNAT